MATKPKVERTPATVTAVASISLPPLAARGGTASVYPFDQLEVGQVFGVKDRDKAGMTSAIGNANRKYRKPKTDDTGATVYKTKQITDAAGTPIQVPDTENPEMVAERQFRARDVTADIAKEIKGTPLEGSKVLVERIK